MRVKSGEIVQIVHSQEVNREGSAISKTSDPHINSSLSKNSRAKGSDIIYGGNPQKF